MPYEERGELACWIWTGHTNPDGTPVIRTRTSCKTARRYYWEREYGPLPDGLELGAVCGARLCVNPRHGDPVPRGEAGARSNRKMTRHRIQQARMLLEGGWSQRKAAEAIGVDEGTLRAARKREKNVAQAAETEVAA